MLWRLLRKNISAVQIIGYAIANLVGLAIVMSALLFYADARKAIKGDGSDLGKDYLVLTRQISLLNTLGIGNGAAQSGAISPEAIKDLEEQPWVKSVGEFLRANFSVAARVNFQGRSMSTYMFFEAVPDNFMDVMPDNWGYDPDDPSAIVPIVISKDYLALYNFGFAASQGMPQITESLISRVPIQLYLSGNGQARQLTGRIVGFSNRLNTVAVPYSFLQWANEVFSPDEEPEPSRLIVEVSQPGAPAISRYLDRAGFEPAGNSLDHGRALYFLQLGTTIVTAIGIVICALALFILMLSISLLMQKNREKNQALIVLGYSPRQIASCYFKLVLIVNAAVLIGAASLMLLCSSLWREMLRQLGYAGAWPWAPIIAGVAIMAAITVWNWVKIARSVR